MIVTYIDTIIHENKWREVDLNGLNFGLFLCFSIDIKHLQVEDSFSEFDRDFLCDFEAHTAVSLSKVMLIFYDARTVVSDLFELSNLAFLRLHFLGWNFGLWVDRFFRHRLLTFDLHQVPIL